MKNITIKDQIKFQSDEINEYTSKAPEGCQSFKVSHMRAILTTLEGLVVEEKKSEKLFDLMKDKYDSFLKAKNLPGLDMQDRNAKRNAAAVANIIKILSKYLQDRKDVATSERILQGFEFILKAWDYQSDFNKSRIELWQISDNFTERLNQIINVHNQNNKKPNKERGYAELKAGIKNRRGN